jgi:hypothetical protein
MLAVIFAIGFVMIILLLILLSTRFRGLARGREKNIFMSEE